VQRQSLQQGRKSGGLHRKSLVTVGEDSRQGMAGVTSMHSQLTQAASGLPADASASVQPDLQRVSAAVERLQRVSAAVDRQRLSRQSRRGGSQETSPRYGQPTPIPEKSKV
jgi:hypothetical protein